jgi:hypothetical protein
VTNEERREANRLRSERWRRAPRQKPTINQFAIGLAGEIDKLFVSRKAEFDAIIEWQADLSIEARNMLVPALKRAAEIHAALTVAAPPPKKGQKQLA